MSNSIDWFKNVLLKDGLHRPNRYFVLFDQNLKIDLPKKPIQPESVTLPGRSFVTTQEQYFGTPRSIPVSNVFDNSVVMTFPLSGSSEERTFFEKWMDAMVDQCNYSQGFEGSGINLRSTVVIQTTNLSGKTIASYQLIEAYPSNIFPMNMGQQMMNDYSRLQVQFNFTSYRYTVGSNLDLSHDCQKG